jgi:tetratricopeptide (TPR) repeat protein
MGQMEEEAGNGMANGDLSSPFLSKAWFLPDVDRAEQAAALYWAQGKLDAWAREQYNLGNAWCQVPEAAFPAKWEKAIAHYEQALSIRTRQKDPERRAATLQNLGTAYRELKSGDRLANLCKAIHCFHEAMQALPGASHAKKRADLHNNLGNAYASLAAEDHEPERNAVRALRHFGRALAVRTKDDWPHDYAVTQFNAGNACIQLALGGMRAEPSLLEARHCFEEARDGFVERRHTTLANLARQRLDFIAELLENAQQTVPRIRVGATTERQSRPLQNRDETPRPAKTSVSQMDLHLVHNDAKPLKIHQ